uniref:Uncharacterized protein n=1 Tax=Rhizophora mucronata TaxID=61149 RepID=A0A2P2R5D2_RHIMU
MPTTFGAQLCGYEHSYALFTQNFRFLFKCKENKQQYNRI